MTFGLDEAAAYRAIESNGKMVRLEPDVYEIVAETKSRKAKLIGPGNLKTAGMQNRRRKIFVEKVTKGEEVRHSLKQP